MKHDFAAINAARRKHDAQTERDLISAEAHAATLIQQQTGASRSDALATAKRMLESKGHVLGFADSAVTTASGDMTFQLTTESSDADLDDAVAEAPKG